MATTESRRARLSGQVVQTKMDKTAVVLVTRRTPHPMYKKYVTKTKKYYAHDEQNVCKDGDEVIIEATRPLSKLKRWRIFEIIKSAPGAGVSE